MPAEPFTPASGRGSGQAPWLFRSIVLALVVAAAVVAVARSWRPGAVAPAAVDHRTLEVTLAPGVALEALPWNSLLPAGGADDFDVSPAGHVVVRIGRHLFDAASGRRLTGGDGSVASFGFASGTLAVLTSGGRLGYLDDTGIHEVGPPPFGDARLQPTSGKLELLLLREREPFGVASLAADRPVRPLTGSIDRIVAADADSTGPVFATETELYVVDPSGRAEVLLQLPDAAPRLLGVAVRGGTIYFSTARGVFAVLGGLSVPLALRVGGPLRSTPEGLVVLNRADGRLYRLAGPALDSLGRPAPEPEPDTARAPPAVTIVCRLGDPYLVRPHQAGDGREYLECHDAAREVRVAAHLTRTAGIPYLVLQVAWTVEAGAPPLDVGPGSVALRFIDAYEAERELERAGPLAYDPTTAVVAAMQHEMTDTAIGSGAGYSGILYFHLPNPSTWNAVGGMYVADVKVRNTTLQFEFSARGLPDPQEAP